MQVFSKNERERYLTKNERDSDVCLQLKGPTGSVSMIMQRIHVLGFPDNNYYEDITLVIILRSDLHWLAARNPQERNIPNLDI